jgi:hypothetical protein
MPRNGSGGYTAPSNSFNPAINGVAATATDWNATLTDLAAAIQQSISADGQTPITGNLQMGGNKLTNLAAGSGTGQSLRFEQLFSQGTLTDIASAATLDIGAQLTNFLRVTGTTGVTSFGTNYNGPRFLIFAGAVLLTHSATLVLPTAANITTAANDALIAIPISGGWQVVAYQRANGSPLVGGDLLNTTRIDVASATTVDLTANAPNTRNINITGTTTITGFTVAIGQVYFVRFNAALTLTNNAAIITQTGANITTSAGDTCILRATAANTVEILSYGYAGIVPNSSITPAKLSQPLTLGTSVATTSGSAIDFTSIPSWVKRISVMFVGVSTNGTSIPQLQIGAGSVQTTGYSGTAGTTGASTGATNYASGALLTSNMAATMTFSGVIRITLITGNTWVFDGVLGRGDTAFVVATGGHVALSGTLDRVRLTTVNGTDAFDAGSVNILYEG